MRGTSADESHGNKSSSSPHPANHAPATSTPVTSTPAASTPATSTPAMSTPAANRSASARSASGIDLDEVLRERMMLIKRVAFWGPALAVAYGISQLRSFRGFRGNQEVTQAHIRRKTRMLGTIVDASVLTPKRQPMGRGSATSSHSSAPGVRIRFRVFHTPFLRTLLWFQPSNVAADSHTLNLSLYGISFPSGAYRQQERDPEALRDSLQRHLKALKNKAILLRLMPSNEPQVSTTRSAAPNTGDQNAAITDKQSSESSSEDRSSVERSSESEVDGGKLPSSTSVGDSAEEGDDGVCHAAIIYVGLFPPWRRNVATSLLRGGLATVDGYSTFSGHSLMRVLYKRAERAARKERIGIWRKALSEQSSKLSKAQTIWRTMRRYATSFSRRNRSN